MTPRPPADAPLVTSRRGHLWIGAERDPATGVAHGPMYVYWEAPAQITQPHPIVLVHGGGGQGLDYLATPDGRPGWASLLVDQGWLVYVVDRPGHGRSPYVQDALGPTGPPLPVGVLTSIFVPPDAPWSSAHTQWPGDRNDANDPALAQFLAGCGPFAADASVRQSLERDRLVQLLERIGPSFVVSNSLGGPCGFLVADARPDLVVGLVQVEPAGPPFATTFGPDTLQWGLAAVPVALDPPAVSAAAYAAEPDRRLVNLARVPIAVVSGEASPFRLSDGPLVDHLQRGGCDAVHLDLATLGVHGNAHGAMFERNHADVLRVVTDWMRHHVDA